MIEFRIKDKPQEVFTWLFQNIGIGGSWLHNLDQEIIVEADDKWGWYYKNGMLTIGIIDERDAILYALRWRP